MIYYIMYHQLRESTDACDKMFGPVWMMRKGGENCPQFNSFSTSKWPIWDLNVENCEHPSIRKTEKEPMIFFKKKQKEKRSIYMLWLDLLFFPVIHFLLSEFPSKSTSSSLDGPSNPPYLMLNLQSPFASHPFHWIRHGICYSWKDTKLAFIVTRRPVYLSIISSSSSSSKPYPMNLRLAKRILH